MDGHIGDKYLNRTDAFYLLSALSNRSGGLSVKEQILKRNKLRRGHEKNTSQK